MSRPIALIAGRGALPGRVVAACEGAGRAVTICGIAGYDGDLARNDRPFRLETLGSLLADLKERGIRDVCLAGAVQRPVLDPTALDAATAPLAERVMGALAVQGDDAALRVLLSLFEQEGFVPLSATDLAPDLLPPEGVPTRARPVDAHGRDAGRGAALIEALGRADLGQACVMRGGQALAVEALPGTDWMLDSLASLPPQLPAGFSGGGLLYKASKPGQDRRVDLPAIGPRTIEAAARAGLDGVAIEAGGVMVLDLEATVSAADTAGLFLWVRKARAEPA